MITIQPLSLPSAPEGEDATFTVEASGLMLSYQWQKDGIPIENTEDTYSGTQSETLRVLSVTEPDDNGMFRVVVTNPTGSVTSTPATLTVCKLLVQYTKTVVCVGFYGLSLVVT